VANLPLVPHIAYLSYQALRLFACGALHQVSSLRFRSMQACKEISALQLRWDTSGSPHEVQLAEDTWAQVFTPNSAAAFWQQRTKAQPHCRPCGGHASVLRSFHSVLSQPLSRAGLFTLCFSLADSLFILALFPVSVFAPTHLAPSQTAPFPPSSPFLCHCPPFPTASQSVCLPH